MVYKDWNLLLLNGIVAVYITFIFSTELILVHYPHKVNIITLKMCIP